MRELNKEIMLAKAKIALSDAKDKTYNCTGIAEDVYEWLLEQVEFYKKIYDLMLADADGRLVMLPCKQDDRVYMVLKMEVKEFIIGRVTVLRSGSVVLTLYGYQGNILAEEIGKTVFLSREAAEAALEKNERC